MVWNYLDMPLLPLASPDLDLVPITEHAVSPNQDIPKDELDIFFRNESNFLPEGKTWETLTDKEKEEIKAKYRFDILRPGVYQGITGIGPMM